MAAPLLRRRRVLAAKVEGTVGTAENLSATYATFNVFNSVFAPNIPHNEREGQGASLAPITSTFGGLSGTATFSVEVTGVTTAPWAVTFLPTVGLKNTSGTFTLDSLPPEGSGSGTKTVTIGGYQDGLFKKIYGAMGNAVFRFRAGMPAMVDFTHVGCWAAPTDTAILAPTYVTTAPLRFVSSALAIGSVNPKCSELTVNLNNVVALREDPGTASGYHSAVITGRRITGTMTIEATLVADYDPHGDMIGRIERQLSFTLGSSGNQAAFTAPKMQITNVREGEINGVAANVIEFQLNRSASAGDDEFQIVLS